MHRSAQHAGEDMPADRAIDDPTVRPAPSIERTFDPILVGLYANDPSVRPLIGAQAVGYLDCTDFVSNPANVALVVDGGCFLFTPDQPGRWEVHTMLTRAWRGRFVVPASHAAARWMFSRTDCVEIVTRLPETNLPADLMARRVGFLPLFQRAGAWEDGSEVRFFSLSLDRWLALDPEALREGRGFHEKLEAAKRAAGRTDEPHPDDEAHDRAVGAACLMASAGNYDKALWTYNRFARLAGYVPAKIVPRAPLVDIGDAIITFTPDLEIVQCLRA